MTEVTREQFEFRNDLSVRHIAGTGGPSQYSPRRTASTRIATVRCTVPERNGC